MAIKRISVLAAFALLAASMVVPALAQDKMDGKMGGDKMSGGKMHHKMSGKMHHKMGGKMHHKMSGKMHHKMGGKMGGKMGDKMGGKM